MILNIILTVLGSIVLFVASWLSILKGFKTNWYQFAIGVCLFIGTVYAENTALKYSQYVKTEREAGFKDDELEAAWGEKLLNIDNLYEELKNQEVDFPEIVLAQALLETNHFESYSCRERNNLFGLTRRDGTYMTFSHWTYSVAAYKKYIQKYKEVPEDYYSYLEKLGYAEDSAYIAKVKQVKKKHVNEKVHQKFYREGC